MLKVSVSEVQSPDIKSMDKHFGVPIDTSGNCNSDQSALRKIELPVVRSSVKKIMTRPLSAPVIYSSAQMGSITCPGQIIVRSRAASKSARRTQLVATREISPSIIFPDAFVIRVSDSPGGDCDRPTSQRSAAPVHTPNIPPDRQTPSNSTKKDAAPVVHPAETSQKKNFWQPSAVMKTGRQQKADEITHSELKSFSQSPHPPTAERPKNVRESFRPAETNVVRQAMAKKYVRALAGMGNHDERVEAMLELNDMIQSKRVSTEWLASQGTLIDDLLSLCVHGTVFQKQHAGNLICHFSSGPISVKHCLTSSHCFSEGMIALLKSKCTINAGHAVLALFHLAQEESVRPKISTFPTLLRLLCSLAKEISAEQASEGSAVSSNQKDIIRQLLATLRILSFQTRSNCLIFINEALAETLVQQSQSEEEETVVYASGLMAELSSADEDDLGFRKSMSSIQGMSKILIRLIKSNNAELKLQALISARNILTLAEVRSDMKGWVPDLYAVLDDSLDFPASNQDLASRSLSVAVLDVLRVLLQDQENVETIHNMKNLYPVICDLLLGCKGILLDRVLAFICAFSKTLKCDFSKILEETIFASLLDIMKEGQSSLRVKMCAICIKNFALFDNARSLLSSNNLVTELLVHLCCTKNSGCSKQAFAALCNLVKERKIAIQLFASEKFMAFIKDGLHGTDVLMTAQSALLLRNALRHEEAAQICCQDKNLIQSILLCSQNSYGNASAETTLNASIAIANLSSNPHFCETIATHEQHAMVRILHSLVMNADGTLTKAPSIGLWALSNLAMRNDRFKTTLGTARAPLETGIRILCDTNRNSEEIQAALSFICNSVFNAPENCKVVVTINNALPILSSYVTLLPESYSHASVAALCSLTAEAEIARKSEWFSDEAVRAISQSLRSKCEELKVASVGLICNLTQGNDSEQLLARFGSQPHIFSDLINILTTEASGPLRAATILALGNLARSDTNKIAIGKEVNILAALHSVLISGSEEEKTHLALLIHFLGFLFINNSSFGQIPGILKEMVRLAAGAEQQSANAIAAISILVCCASNATCVIQEMNGELLPLLTKLLRTGSQTQQNNSLVCLWNLAANGEKARDLIGREGGIFPLLIQIVRQAENDVVWQAAGLLGELMKDNERNATLFFKTPDAVQVMTTLALETEDDRVELAAAIALVNFALNGQETNLRHLSEMENGLMPIARVVQIGSSDDRKRALFVLASPGLHSVSARKQIARLPGLLSAIIAGTVDGDDAEQETCARILWSLSMSISTRFLLISSDEMIEIIQTNVVGNSASFGLRKSIFGCLANLVLSVEFGNKIVHNNHIITALMAIIIQNQQILVDLALEALHNMLAFSAEFRCRMAANEILVERLVDILKEKSKKCALHAAGALYHLCADVNKMPTKLLSNPKLIPNLLASIQSGGEKQKELACATLAILGENDDDISSITDDMFNMMVAMADGALASLCELFIRGTGQQSLHATAVLSNLLISSGAFIKGQLASSDDFIISVIRYMKSAAQNHRRYALRLFLYLVKGDVFICERACQEPNLLQALFEAAESGSASSHKSYACYSLAEIVMFDSQKVATFDGGQVFRLLAQIMAHSDNSVVRSGLQLLKCLCLDYESRRRVLATYLLFDQIAMTATVDAPDNLALSLEILLQLVTASDGTAPTFELCDTPNLQSAIANGMASTMKTARINAALILYNVGNTAVNAKAIAEYPSVFSALLNMFSLGEDDEAKAACMALSQILYFQKTLEEGTNKLRHMLERCIHLLAEHQKQYQSFASWDEFMLRCLLGIAMHNENSEMLAETTVFPVLIQRMKKGSDPKLVEIMLAIICNLIMQHDKAKLAFADCEDSMNVVLRAVKGTNDESAEAFRLISALSHPPSEICSRLRKADNFWSTLVVFLDDRNVITEVLESTAFLEQRLIALELLLLHAQGMQDIKCITACRQSAQILSRLVTNDNPSLRMKSLILITKCCAVDKQFCSRLGYERFCINILLDHVTALPTVFREMDEKLAALQILTNMADVSEHSERIGTSPGFLESLIQMMLYRGAESQYTDNISSQFTGQSTKQTDIINSPATHASTCLRAYCSKKDICAFALRLPFPVVESLLKAVLSKVNSDRIHALSILWSMANSGKASLMVISKNTIAIYDTLHKLCQLYENEIQQGVMLISSLLALPSFRFALLKHELLNVVVALFDSDNDLISIPALRIIGDLAGQDESSKAALGKLTLLNESLMRIKYRGRETVAAAAMTVIDEMCKHNELNAGLFRRLRGKYLD